MASPGDFHLSSEAINPDKVAYPSGQRVEGEFERDTKAPEELKNEALPRQDVENMLWEIRQQPHWRKESDRCVDYYDNNQLSPETLEKLQERGQPPLISNFIKPTVDTVLGMEAKTRTDWKVKPEDDGLANADTAEALSLKLAHAEKESRADRACSDAYAAQMKAGLGFVEVARETDPFKYPYRVKSIHRREIFWDWKAELYDLTDARYLVRRRWQDVEHAIAMFPQYATLLRNTVSGFAGFDPMHEGHTNLAQSFEIERDTRLEASDWRDTARQRVCLYEIWYRKWVRGYVMTLSDGRVVEVDFDNPRHCEAIASKVVTVKMATFQKVRLAWYCGPHFLFDVPSPHKHNFFPYVPFFGYREDLTLAPYGLIRTMLSPQDEINARKSKGLWILNSRRVIAEDDSVEDHQRAAEEVARPDAYIRLKKNRNPNGMFKVEHGGELAAQQFQAMQEAKQEISETSGIHKTMMGQASGASSGLAINSLVEQGLNTLGEINDNYRFARRMVGEMLFAMLQEDLSDKPVKVTLGDGSSARVVVLNLPAQDPQTGEMVLQNNVAKVRARVVLDDIPSTPTFRMQQLQMMTEITKSLPPDVQAMIIDFVIGATDLPGKEKIIDRLRKGMKLPDDTEEGQAAQQQAQQAEQAQQQQMLAMDMREREARIAQIEAATQKSIADIQNMGGDDGQIAAIQQQAQQTITGLNGQIAELRAKLGNKTLEIMAKERMERDRNAITLEKEEMATMRALEVAAINHPPADMNAVLAQIQALAEKIEALTNSKKEQVEAVE